MPSLIGQGLVTMVIVQLRMKTICHFPSAKSNQRGEDSIERMLLMRRSCSRSEKKIKRWEIEGDIYRHTHTRTRRIRKDRIKCQWKENIERSRLDTHPQQIILKHWQLSDFDDFLFSKTCIDHPGGGCRRFIDDRNRRECRQGPC